jgi:YesN/AraC family two-component response regulator
MRKPTYNILIVDDDPDIRSFLTKILENLGHTIYEADNNTDAFNIVMEVVPHLILLDIKLENEYGFGLIDKIQTIDKDSQIGIIMISALSNQKAIATAAEYGVLNYLIKPLTNTTIIDVMRKVEGELGFTPIKYLDENEKNNIRVSCIGTLTKINEISIVIRSKVKFSETIPLKIESDYLRDLGLNHAHFSAYEPSHDLSPGVYDSLVQLIGLNEKNLTTIRKVKSKKA